MGNDNSSDSSHRCFPPIVVTLRSRNTFRMIFNQEDKLKLDRVSRSWVYDQNPLQLGFRRLIRYVSEVRRFGRVFRLVRMDLLFEKRKLRHWLMSRSVCMFVKIQSPGPLDSTSLSSLPVKCKSLSITVFYLDRCFPYERYLGDSWSRFNSKLYRLFKSFPTLPRSYRESIIPEHARLIWRIIRELCSFHLRRVITTLVQLYTFVIPYLQNGESSQYVTDRLRQFSDPLARFQPINGEWILLPNIAYDCLYKIRFLTGNI